jgi:hypothetical protein
MCNCHIITVESNWKNVAITINSKNKKDWNITQVAETSKKLTEAPLNKKWLKLLINVQQFW